MSRLSQEEAHQLEKLSNEYCLEQHKQGKVAARKKCCGKCAFRKNSPERCDPWGWMRQAEKWAEGTPFFCHEGVPGHQQRVAGADLQLCAGWSAMQGQPDHVWFDLAHLDKRDSDPKFD